MIRFASWFCYSCVYVQLIGETWDLYDTHGRTKKPKKTKTNEKRQKKKTKTKTKSISGDGVHV